MINVDRKPAQESFVTTHLETLRRDRGILAEEIEESRELIKRSRTLLKRIDRLLAKAGEKP